MPTNQGGDDFVFVVGEDGKKLPVLTRPADAAVFEVSITGTNLPISPGDTLNVDYKVENTGGLQDTQDIRLDIDGSREDRDSDVTLAAGNSTTGTLTYSSSASDSRLRVVVWTDQTQAALDASLNANFSVTIDSTNSPVDEGDDLNVTSTIENTGTESGNQDITLEVDGATRDTYSSLTVAGGEKKEITLTWATSDGDIGGYTASVSSQDDSDSTSVDVGADLVDDFEDGDVSEWSGATAMIAATNSNPIAGNWSMEVSDDVNGGTIQNGIAYIDSGDGVPTKPSTVAGKFRWSNFDASGVLDADRHDGLGFGDKEKLKISVDGSGAAYASAAGSDKIGNLSTDTVYRFEMTNIDYNNGTFDATIYKDSDGSEVGSATGDFGDGSLSDDDRLEIYGVGDVKFFVDDLRAE